MANNCIDERNHGNEASNIYAITRVTDDLVAVPQKHDIRIQSVTGDTKTILVGHTGLIVHLQLMDEGMILLDKGLNTFINLPSTPVFGLSLSKKSLERLLVVATTTVCVYGIGRKVSVCLI
jgi:hypothetical protein